MDEFDRFCEEHNITPDEAPAAFAAWLNGATGWDGAMAQVADEPIPGQADAIDHLFPASTPADLPSIGKG